MVKTITIQDEKVHADIMVFAGQMQVKEGKFISVETALIELLRIANAKK